MRSSVTRNAAERPNGSEEVVSISEHGSFSGMKRTVCGLEVRAIRGREDVWADSGLY